MPERQCLRKTLEQSGGTEPCKEGCEGFEGAELHTQGSAAGEGAEVLEGAGGSLRTVRKTSPGETVPEKEDKVHGHNRAGRKASKAAGRCGGGCEGFGGGRRQSWNRKKDISGTALQVERPLWKLEKPLNAAVPKRQCLRKTLQVATVEAGKATGRCSAHCES